MSGPRFDRLDVTPFIDVLLVMLILFMIAVPVPERPLETSVPSGEGGGGAVARVRVGPVGLWLDEAPLGGIDVLVRTLGARAGTEAVLVEADDGVVYERVVAIVDAVQGAGRFHVGLVGEAPGPLGD